MGRRGSGEALDLAGFAAPLAAALPPEAGALVVVDSVGSTNLLARRIATAYLDAGRRAPRATIVALAQRAGRGRRGRSWRSPARRGVYATLLRPVAAGELAWLPLLVPVGLCRGLSRYLETPCQVKWPNDLVVRGRKIGGVLIESVTRGTEGAALIGFGVNHSHRAADLPGPGATALRREAPRCPPLAELAAELLAEVSRELRRLGAPAGGLEAYRRVSLHRPGDRLRFRSEAGPVEGTFRGFDERGFLRLESDTGEIVLRGGEIE